MLRIRMRTQASTIERWNIGTTTTRSRIGRGIIGHMTIGFRIAGGTIGRMTIGFRIGSGTTQERTGANASKQVAVRSNAGMPWGDYVGIVRWCASTAVHFGVVDVHPFRRSITEIPVRGVRPWGDHQLAARRPQREGERQPGLIGPSPQPIGAPHQHFNVCSTQ
jgi:hypothetical protein